MLLLDVPGLQHVVSLGVGMGVDHPGQEQKMVGLQTVPCRTVISQSTSSSGISQYGKTPILPSMCVR